MKIDDGYSQSRDRAERFDAAIKRWNKEHGKITVHSNGVTMKMAAEIVREGRNEGTPCVHYEEDIPFGSGRCTNMECDQCMDVYMSLCAETKASQAIGRLALINRAKRFEEVPDLEDLLPAVGEYIPEPVRDVAPRKYVPLASMKDALDALGDNKVECPLPREIGNHCQFYGARMACFVRQTEMSTAAFPMASPVVLPICFKQIPR